MNEILSQNKEYAFLQDQDIDVNFKNSEEKDFIDNNPCIICYDFLFEGKIKKSEQSYILVAEKMEAQLTNLECCD